MLDPLLYSPPLNNSFNTRPAPKFVGQFKNREKHKSRDSVVALKLVIFFVLVLVLALPLASKSIQNPMKPTANLFKPDRTNFILVQYNLFFQFEPMENLMKGTFKSNHTLLKIS